MSTHKFDSLPKNRVCAKRLIIRFFFWSVVLQSFFFARPIKNSGTISSGCPFFWGREERRLYWNLTPIFFFFFVFLTLIIKKRRHAAP